MLNQNALIRSFVRNKALALAFFAALGLTPLAASAESAHVPEAVQSEASDEAVAREATPTLETSTDAGQAPSETPAPAARSAGEPLAYSEDERMVVELLIQNDALDYGTGEPTFHFARAVEDRFGKAAVHSLNDLILEVLDNPFRADHRHTGEWMILPESRIGEIRRGEKQEPVVLLDADHPVALHFDTTEDVMAEVIEFHRGERKAFVCRWSESDTNAVRFKACRDFDAFLRSESEVMRNRFLTPQTDADWLLAYTVLKFCANLHPDELAFCRDSVAQGKAFTQEDVDLILSRNGGLFDATNVEERFGPVGFDASKIESLVKRGKALSAPNKPETRI